jgi:hypothetical protein
VQDGECRTEMPGINEGPLDSGLGSVPCLGPTNRRVVDVVRERDLAQRLAVAEKETSKPWMQHIDIAVVFPQHRT